MHAEGCPCACAVTCFSPCAPPVVTAVSHCSQAGLQGQHNGMGAVVGSFFIIVLILLFYFQCELHSAMTDNGAMGLPCSVNHRVL